MKDIMIHLLYFAASGVKKGVRVALCVHRSVPFLNKVVCWSWSDTGLVWRM
jgi:hypothetical protein